MRYYTGIDLHAKESVVCVIDDKDSIHMSAFNCLAPLYYIEHSRIKCPHAGRCREEGLLLALLDGRKVLDYSHKKIIELPRVRCRRKAAKEAA